MGWKFEHFLLQAVEKQTIRWTISPSNKNVENVFYVLFWLSNNALLDKKYNILLVLFSPGSAETNIGCGGKLNGHLMASCQKLLKSVNSFFKLQLKMSRIFIPDTV